MLMLQNIQQINTYFQAIYYTLGMQAQTRSAPSYITFINSTAYTSSALEINITSFS
jgi:hypothetical protein